MVEATRGEVSGPDGAGLLLTRVGSAAARAFARRLDPLGLEPRQFGLMRAVAAAQGQSQQALGERLLIPPSRMVTLVDDLERRGVLERRRNPADRRAHALHLTEAGRRLLVRAMCVAEEHEAEVCAALTGPERAQLVALLHRVAAGLGVPEPGTAGVDRPTTEHPSLASLQSTVAAGPPGGPGH